MFISYHIQFFYYLFCQSFLGHKKSLYRLDPIQAFYMVHALYHPHWGTTKTYTMKCDVSIT